LTPFSHC